MRGWISVLVAVSSFAAGSAALAQPAGTPPTAVRTAHALQIKHEPIACFMAERYPQIDACFEPSPVERAQVVFRAENSTKWHFVEMHPVGQCYRGTLPPPLAATSRVLYYMTATSPEGVTARLPVRAATVVTEDKACTQGTVGPFLSAATVQVEGGASPAGFVGVEGAVSHTAKRVVVAVVGAGVVGAGVGLAAAAGGGGNGTGGTSVTTTTTTQAPVPTSTTILVPPTTTTTTTRPPATTTTTTTVPPTTTTTTVPTTTTTTVPTTTTTTTVPPTTTTTTTTVPPTTTTTTTTSTTTTTTQPSACAIDTTAPTVSITEPKADANLGLTAQITVDARDAGTGASGMDHVRIYAQELTGTRTAEIATVTGSGPTYRATWTLPSCQSRNERWRIFAEAVDKCGHSATQNVRVNRDPSVCPTATTDPQPLATTAAESAATLTSELAIADAQGQVIVNGSEASFPRAGRSDLAISRRRGQNRVEAVLVDSGGSAGTWRFEVAGPIRAGSLRSLAGEPVAVGANTIVFRLRGRPGERVVFVYEAP